MLSKLLDTILPKKMALARRRKRYEEIKVMVVSRHLAGLGGMVIPNKYDSIDRASFKPPMYQWAMKDDRWCLFWRKDLMTEEVGKPAPPKTDE